MTETDVTSTLKRPNEQLIQRFGIWQVKDQTIRSHLEKGFSLAICCKACPRTTEWTPPTLLVMFGNRLDLRLADLVPRLSCTGANGCGAREVAVFPHLYDGRWSWPPA